MKIGNVTFTEEEWAEKQRLALIKSKKQDVKVGVLLLLILGMVVGFIYLTVDHFMAPTLGSDNSAYELSKITRGEKLVLNHLKDPSSARFSGVLPGKSALICGRVNSKNSFGGYTGAQGFVVNLIGEVYLQNSTDPDTFISLWNTKC